MFKLQVYTPDTNKMYVAGLYQFVFHSRFDNGDNYQGRDLTVAISYLRKHLGPKTIITVLNVGR